MVGLSCLDLNALELFVVAANSGSLSEASRRTAVPLPTVSRKIAKLEEQLGIRLLDRGTKGLALTPAGAQLLAEAAPGLSVLAEAKQRLYDAGGIAGTLRVSIPPHFYPMWPVFSEFRRRHPKVRFETFVTDRRVDLVGDGIDVAIRIGEGGHTGYVGRTVARYRHRLVASPKLLRSFKIDRPSDLNSVPCACWRKDGPTFWTLGKRRVELKPILSTNDYTLLRRLVLDGDVVTELPPFMAEKEFVTSRLEEILTEYPLPIQNIRALTVERRVLSPLIRSFLDFTADSLSVTAVKPDTEFC